MNLRIVALTALAPLPFWILGLPWFLKGDPGRIRLAPLVGCALAGFYAELALVLGIPMPGFLGGVLLLSLGALAFLGRSIVVPLRGALREWVPIYLVAVLAASVSPFPILGNWEGDWHVLYQMGQSVLQGTLPMDMLTRPPLFGAAAIPLWIVGGNGLISYQLMAATASAAAVTATLRFMDHFWPRSQRLRLLPLLLSPFFLHHTAAAWAKLLAGGLILAATLEGFSARRFASAALFALSVAVHEGSILWAPCVLLAHATGPTGWRGALRALWPMALAGFLVVAPLQVWILVKYGLGAKIAASPVLTDRDRTPFVLKSLHAILAAFVGWGPPLAVTRWLRHAHPWNPAVVAKEAYWLVTSWITTFSGTLAGLLFPFLFLRRSLVPSPIPRTWLRPWPLACIGFAVVMNGVLPGFSSNEGTMQNALAALALALYAVFAGRLSFHDGRDLASVRRATVIMVVFGTIPWLLANLGISAGLRFSAAFRERLQTASEGDYFRVKDNGLQTLGMDAFPEVPLFCVAMLLVLLLFMRERSGRRELDQDLPPSARDGAVSVGTTLSSVAPTPEKF